MFKKKSNNKTSKDKTSKNENYERVYKLHQDAKFLFYVDDVYLEPYKGQSYVKMVGVVAKGSGTLKDQYMLYNCNGRKKAVVTANELYVGQAKVEEIAGGEKLVAIYPNEQEISYKAGDFLCILEGEENVND